MYELNEYLYVFDGMYVIFHLGAITWVYLQYSYDVDPFGALLVVMGLAILLGGVAHQGYLWLVGLIDRRMEAFFEIKKDA